MYPQSFASRRAVNPITPEEIRQAHIERTQELIEEAQRLARSYDDITFEEIVQTSPVRPSIGAPRELEILSEVGREIDRLRKNHIQKIHGAKPRLRFGIVSRRRRSPADRHFQTYKALVDQEGKVGAQVFGNAPANQTWHFYFENSAGRDEWFFIRRHSDSQESVVRYVCEPTHVRKIENGSKGEIVAENELVTLAEAARRYHQLVRQSLYETAIIK